MSQLVPFFHDKPTALSFWQESWDATEIGFDHLPVGDRGGFRPVRILARHLDIHGDTT